MMIKKSLEMNYLNSLATEIIDSAYTVHTALGPGLLERVYEYGLSFELQEKGYDAQSQVQLPNIYRDHVFGEGFRVDILVNESVIVEDIFKNGRV